MCFEKPVEEPILIPDLRIHLGYQMQSFALN